jgi:hypothetical protein
MLAKVEVKKHSLKTNGISNCEIKQSKKVKTDQELWDEELITPKSLKLLELLSENAIKEFDKGECEPGGFAD